MPFIMLTAETDEDQVKAAKDTGVDAFIRKPFNKEALHENLLRAYERRYGDAA